METQKILTWDYKGHKNNTMFFGTQADWNKSILTQFNYIKGMLWQESLVTQTGVMNVVVPKILKTNLIDTLKEFNPLTSLINESFKITFISDINVPNIHFLNGYEIHILNFRVLNLSEPIVENSQDEKTETSYIHNEIRDLVRTNDKKLDEIISLIKNNGRKPFMGPM